MQTGMQMPKMSLDITKIQTLLEIAILQMIYKVIIVKYLSSLTNLYMILTHMLMKPTHMSAPLNTTHSIK